MDKLPLKPWGSTVGACYTSNGDYDADARIIEPLIGGKLYSSSPVPPLPVPDLDSTLEKVKKSVLALAKNDEERENVIRDIENFKRDGGAALQRRLNKRASSLPSTSWLQLWWNTLGYLSVRDPVPVNVSYFFQFRSDPSCSTGIQRGASMLVASAIFRRMVMTGSLPPEVLGRRRVPLCQAAWKYMFNACRVPRKKQDEYTLHDPTLHRHVCVVRRGIFFRVPFVDADHNPLPLAVIESLLAQCVAVADCDGGELGPAVSLGAMSGDGRDEWAEAREMIRRVEGGREAMDVIETSALLLCLDPSTPVSDPCTASLCWYGQPTSPSRYFDKPLQLICADNGKAGLLGEHSMMDGMPVVRYADAVVSTSYDDARRAAPLTADGANGLAEERVAPVFGEGLVRRMREDEGLRGKDAESQARFASLVSSQSLSVSVYRAYGSSFMKSSKFSPDAYVQMAVQLASYRLFGENVGTYEASQVRTFKHGRTETTRSCGPESVAWCAEMGLRRDGGEADAEKRRRRVAMLRDAAKAHVGYLGMAGKGQGVDRHLFGLSMMVGKREAPPKLFSNPTFVKAKTWRISTSHLTHPKFDNWGWGEVVPDGVGVAYSIHPGRCVFNVTARKETGYSPKMAYLLEEALEEMRELLEAEALGSGTARSKL